MKEHTSDYMTKPYRLEIINMESGRVFIQYPARMTPDELQDFEDLIALVIRKLKRASEIEKQGE